MPAGKCPMCVTHKELIRSHLMSSGLYGLCDAPDSDPVVVTQEVVMQTGRELKDYVLCGNCDNSLSENGESWILPKLARIDGSFPLYEMVRKIGPEYTDERSTLFAAAKNTEVKCEKIIHYAMSTFFKAAVHPWRGGRAEPLIDLGKYTEPVRAFLRDEAPFPEKMALMVGMSPAPARSIMFTQPYRGSARETHNFIFCVPGMEFVLLVGNGVTEETRRISFAPAILRPLLVMKDLSEETLKIARGVSRKAHKSKKLLEYVETSAHLKEYLKTRGKGNGGTN